MDSTPRASVETILKTLRTSAKAQAEEIGEPVVNCISWQAADLIERQEVRKADLMDYRDALTLEVDTLKALVERLHDTLDNIKRVASHPPEDKVIKGMAIKALGLIKELEDETKKPS